MLNIKQLKVNYINDVHLDFYCQFNHSQIKYEKSVREFVGKLLSNTLEIGDVLIIAGDLGHMNVASGWFLDEASKYFNKVVVTYGNHDLYMLSKSMNKKYRTSDNRINELYEKVKDNNKIHFLGQEFDGILEYDSFKIGGDILMSNPESDIEIMFYRQNMNDSNYINFGYYKEENAKYLNQKNIKYYNQLKEEDLDIFISHYPIILTDSHLRYGISDGSLGSYQTKVSDIIAPHNFYGHVHEQKVYNKFGEHFYTHALGYPGENLSLGFGYTKLNKVKG